MVNPATRENMAHEVRRRQEYAMGPATLKPPLAAPTSGAFSAG